MLALVEGVCKQVLLCNKCAVALRIVLLTTMSQLCSPISVLCAGGK